MPSPADDARARALAIVACVLEYVRIRCAPDIIVPPDFDLLPCRHPARFASDVTSMVLTGSCQPYRQISLGLPLKYFPMRFSISHYLAVGRDIILQHSLTAYCMSGLSGWK